MAISNRFKMNVNKRIKSIREHSNKTQQQFADAIGISRSNLSQIEIGKIQPTLEVIKQIVKVFNVPYDQLLDGEAETTGNIVSDEVSIYRTRTDRKDQAQYVPLYNLEAYAGLVPLLDNARYQQTNEYLSIPHLPKCDGAVFITGDSMYPLLKSGDIVCYKQINKEDIFYGEMYLLGIDMAGDEYISVKFVQKSELPDHVKLVSQNQHHQERDVHLDKITAIALVKASIRINSMN